MFLIINFHFSPLILSSSHPLILSPFNFHAKRMKSAKMSVYLNRFAKIFCKGTLFFAHIKIF